MNLIITIMTTIIIWTHVEEITYVSAYWAEPLWLKPFVSLARSCHYVSGLFGRAMRDGVIIDSGRQDAGTHRKDDGDWWLDLYVMLSRGTILNDLLFLRAPDMDFFAKGPPKTLHKELAKFSQRTDDCRLHAEKHAMDLDLGRFLRKD